MMQQHDSANTRVDVSMSTLSAATQDGPVIYKVDSISSRRGSTLRSYGSHSERNTRLLFDLLPHNAPSSIEAG